jgi:hypothetical protein
VRYFLDAREFFRLYDNRGREWAKKVNFHHFGQAPAFKLSRRHTVISEKATVSYDCWFYALTNGNISKVGGVRYLSQRENFHKKVCGTWRRRGADGGVAGNIGFEYTLQVRLPRLEVADFEPGGFSRNGSER